MMKNKIILITIVIIKMFNIDVKLRYKKKGIPWEIAKIKINFALVI